uniref:Prolamin-like domain-containing protein n=1 Tax=Manihot esculenta TaxID=3983 RepID=A0A2C9V911_MANES
MKTQFAILLLVLLCSVDCFPQGLARPWLEAFDEEGIQNFALPPVTHEPNVSKCLKIFHEEKICVGEILLSIRNHKVIVDPRCCSLVDKISEDCSGTCFAGLTESFFSIVLKNYCAYK